MDPAPLRRIAIFCGSSNGVKPAYAEIAQKAGALLASQGTWVHLTAQDSLPALSSLAWQHGDLLGMLIQP